jgi:hypothetical protein
VLASWAEASSSRCCCTACTVRDTGIVLYLCNVVLVQNCVQLIDFVTDSAIV